MKKWIFYKSICIINSILLILFALLPLAIIIISPDFYFNNATIIFPVIACFLYVYISNNLRGIRFVNKLRNKEDISTKETKRLGIFFKIQLFLQLILLYVSFVQEPNLHQLLDAISNLSNNPMNVVKLVSDILPLLIFITAGYYELATYKLIGIVNKNHIDELDNIGKMNNI